MTQVPPSGNFAPNSANPAAGQGDAIGLAKTPPHSIDAEVQVIGSLILDSASADIVVQILEEEFFFRPAHQILFSTIINMREAGKPIETVSVKDELNSLGRIEAVGGVEYLAAIVQSVSGSANVEYYAKIIRDKAMLRELIRAGGEISVNAYDSSQEAQQVVDQAEERIFAIAQKQIGDQAVLIKDLLQQTFESLAEHEGKGITGLDTGYHQLNELTSGLQDSEMIILAARPSMGKTSFLLNIAEYMTVTNADPTVVFSLEMSKEQLCQRLLASHARFNLRQMRQGSISTESWNALQAAADNLSNAPLYIDDSPTLTALQLRAKARRLKESHGIKCILVDYLQLITYSGRADNRQAQITEMSAGIKALARELKIPVIAAAQLNRGPEDRPQHRPRMSDLRESGSLEQDADVIMLLHNEDYYHKGEEDYSPTEVTELIIAKQRNGPTGTAYFTFIPNITRFEPAAQTHMGE